MRELLIVIPARGGSKGLARKNIRLLGEIPLIQWTAEAVKRANIPRAHCILSTEDEEIAKIGLEIGLDVPFLRPAELATDDATAEGLALHALDWIESKRGVKPESVMLMQPTSPFRLPEDISKAVSMLTDQKIDGVLGVKPIYNTLATLYKASESMDLRALGSREEYKSRRQEVETLYTPNGALYLVRTSVFRKLQTFFPDKYRGLVMDQISSIDIDDLTDWRIAEALFEKGLTWRN